MRGSLAASMVALGWVLLGLASVGSCALALWITLSLARGAAHVQAGPLASSGSPAWSWLIAVFLTLGLPFAIAIWKHAGDARRITLTMAWLPFVWNAGGLLLASQVIPDIVGTALHHHGAWLAASQVGESHSTTRVLSALGHHTAELMVPPPPAAPAKKREITRALPLERDIEVDEARAISIPFSEQGTAIVMQAMLEGQTGKVKLPYLFDTGASFTTISSDSARQIGIPVPEDAPKIEFNTASGPRQSRMVYLPALQVGDIRIEGLLVSVCDACVNNRTAGLLGLNVMREFFVQMDYKNERMILLPRVHHQRPNRAYDIEPMVDLKVQGSPEVWLGRIHWVVSVHNKGTKALEHVVPVVRFENGPALAGQPIARIAPGERGRSLVEGRASSNDREGPGVFTLSLAEAYW